MLEGRRSAVVVVVAATALAGLVGACGGLADFGGGQGSSNGELTDDGQRCYTLAGNDEELALLEVDVDGHGWKVREHYPRPLDVTHTEFNFGLRADELVLSSSGDYGYTRIDRKTGEVSHARVPLGSSPGTPNAVSDGSSYFHLCGTGDEVCRYESFDDLTADRVVDRIGPLRNSSVLAVGNGGVHYGAWHSGDSVTIYDPSDGNERTVALQGHNDWFFGLAAARGSLFVVTPVREEGSHFDLFIVEFDARTGRRLDSTAISLRSWPYHPMLTGLACAK